MPNDPLFIPLDLPGGVRMHNRIVMAPMTTYSANADGTISDAELEYYRARAAGPGLVLTGCTHVTENGVGFIEEFAGYDDRFLPSLTSLAEAAKSGDNPAVLQIFHAGDKARPERTPNGEIVSASARVAPPSQQGSGGTPVRELSEPEIDDMIHAFGETTRRAIEADFDGVELHGAHGFLLQNFLSPAVNTRDDGWGGTPEKRARFAREVTREVRRVVRDHADRAFVVGYRISLEEPGIDGGLRADESLALVEHLITDGSIDYIHASLYDVLTDTALTDTAQADGPSGPTATQTTLIRRLHDVVDGRVAIFAAGGFATPDRARQGLAEGLDAVVIGRGLVMDPQWVQRAEAGDDARIRAEVDPAKSADDMEVPQGLHDMIAASPGWFPLVAQGDTSQI